MCRVWSHSWTQGGGGSAELDQVTYDLIPEVLPNLILREIMLKSAPVQRENGLQGVPDIQVLPSLLAQEQEIWKAEVFWQTWNCVIDCSLIIFLSHINQE